MEEGMTRADLASRLGIAPATVRKWQVTFKDRLVTPPGVKGMSQTLILDPADVRTLSAVAALRKAGYTLEETAARLDHYLSTQPLLPELRPIEEGAAGVSPAVYVDVLRALEAAEAAAAAVTEERDYLRGRIIALEAQIVEEARRAAAAEARAEWAAARPPGFWARLLGGRRPSE